MKKCFLSLILTAVLMSSEATAVPDFDRSFDVSALSLDPAETGYEFKTRRFGAGKGGMRVVAALPQEKQETPFPVLYVLDGNILLETMTGDRLKTLAFRKRSPVLVFVGYGTDLWSDAVEYRAYDYTPPCTILEGDEAQRNADCRDDMHPDRMNGGAEDFLELIENQVKPWVGTFAPAEREDTTLLGHSYGGLFVLYAMMTKPGTFGRYAAADPALWWKSCGIFPAAERFSEEGKMPSAELLILHSGKRRPRSGNAFMRRVEKVRGMPEGAAEAFLKVLARKEGLAVREADFPAHTHGALLKDSFLYLLDLPLITEKTP